MAIYRECLSHLDEIKKVMLDPVLREQEAEKAKLIKAEMFVQLQRKMLLYRAKNTALSERDMKHLMKQFGKYGFTGDEIKRLFNSPFTEL